MRNALPALTAVALTTVLVAAAQQPPVVNGRVTAQAAATPLPDSFQRLVAAQAEPAWIGYTVPVVDARRAIGGSDLENGGTVTSNGSNGERGWWNGCRLESGTTGNAAPPVPAVRPPGPVLLEGSDRLAVLFRVVAAKVDRIRTVSADCTLDAGGRALTWLDGVRPGDSVALLESLANSGGSSNRVTDGALAALALHADASADDALERLVSPGHPDAIRKKVTFWLGNARDQRGFERLRRIVRDDASMDVRKGAVFGLSQSTVADAVPALTDVARNSSEPSLRGEALFWLAQKAGRQAAAAITERVENDPDTEVKKKAVFALSQLPKDEGVPLLISVARTNTNPAVRKQAMFWLGESKDPRAIDFFTEILK